MLISRVSQVNNTNVMLVGINKKRNASPILAFGQVPPSVQNELGVLIRKFPGLGEYGSRLMLELDEVMVHTPNGSWESALESRGEFGTKLRDTVTRGIVAIGRHVVEVAQSSAEVARNSNLSVALRRMQMHIQEDTSSMPEFLTRAA